MRRCDPCGASLEGKPPWAKGCSAKCRAKRNRRDRSTSQKSRYAAQRSRNRKKVKGLSCRFCGRSDRHGRFAARSECERCYQLLKRRGPCLSCGGPMKCVAPFDARCLRHLIYEPPPGMTCKDIVIPCQQ